MLKLKRASVCDRGHVYQNTNVCHGRHTKLKRDRRITNILIPALYLHRFSSSGEGSLPPGNIILRLLPLQLLQIGQETGLDRTRQDWTGQYRTGQETGQDQTRQDKTGQDKTRQDRTGQGKTGQDRTGQDRTGQDRARLARQDRTGLNQIGKR